MTTTVPPDPSQKIPAEARGRVRRKKKSAGGGGGGGGVGGGRGAGNGERGTLTGSLSSFGKEVEGRGDKDRTFVTSRGLTEDDHSDVHG